MFYTEVAVPVALNQTFTYKYAVKIPLGCRVRIPFGEKNRRVVGVVIAHPQSQAKQSLAIKDVEEQLDAEPIYNAVLLELAGWMADYYLYPIGEVLKAMLPLAQVNSKSIRYRLTSEGLTARSEDSHLRTELLRFLWKRQAPLAAKSLTKKLGIWQLQQMQPKKHTLRALEKEGLLEKLVEQKSKLRSVWDDVDLADLEPLATKAQEQPELTAQQAEVLKTFIEEGLQIEESKVFLLHGVTGAGKTEIYLRAIDYALSKDPKAQALVLVPEIALTPQMTRVFSARFPQSVAVVHSAMAVNDRWAELQKMRQGQKRILIGPRSAVFSAFANLALIIVDEEHDGSYKQGSGLSYNGRDVAVMRGHLEKVSVLLGSATPAMESYSNALQGKYRLLALPERVHGRKMPEIELLVPAIGQGFARKLGPAARRTRVIDLPVDSKIIEALEANLKLGMQAMVLVNRRGFAYYVYSIRQKKSLACPNCSISLTVHEKSTLLRCHYCDFQRSMESMIPSHLAEEYVLVGYGSEQMEHYIQKAIPGAKIQRVDSDTVVQKDKLPEILDDFRSGRIDILVGTQILAKGHDFPKVTLICILELDQTLNLPDFRAGEKTFQLMVQASGRAGRGEWPGKVMIQTQKADHPILLAGLGQDYKKFWHDQVSYRKAHLYPPFSRMILFEFSGGRRDQLSAWMTKVDHWVQAKLKATNACPIQVLGPAVPPIEMIRGRSRRTILMMSAHRKELWEFAREFLRTFQKTPGDIRLRVDVDPQSLM